MIDDKIVKINCPYCFKRKVYDKHNFNQYNIDEDLKVVQLFFTCPVDNKCYADVIPLDRLFFHILNEYLEKKILKKQK